MKTILYNPIFINPQAYYVFPNLNGQLVEQKDATIEPAKYSGIIEVKIIANGDIHKIKQFKNTDNIDFTEFSESWVRINQYTLEGNIVLGEWKIGNIEGKPSLDPSIKQALVGVWIADGKSNNDSDSNIIKNKLSGRGGDFEIFNAAQTLTIDHDDIVEISYPYPVYEGEQLKELLSTEEWSIPIEN